MAGLGDSSEYLIFTLLLLWLWLYCFQSAVSFVYLASLEPNQGSPTTSGGRNGPTIIVIVIVCVPANVEKCALEISREGRK